METPRAEKVVIGQFSFQGQLGSKSGKTLSISGCLVESDDIHDNEKHMDLFHDLLDRQVIRGEIPALEAELEARFRTLRDQKGHLEAITKEVENIRQSGKPKAVIDREIGGKLDVIRNLSVSIEAVTKDVDLGLASVSEAKHKIGRK